MNGDCCDLEHFRLHRHRFLRPCFDRYGLSQLAALPMNRLSRLNEAIQASLESHMRERHTPEESEQLGAIQRAALARVRSKVLGRDKLQIVDK